MLDDRFLVLGLNALARAHAFDYFADGHRGGAVLSACFFCREVEVEAGVPEAIGGIIDEHYAGTPLFAPWPETGAGTAAADEILAAMATRIEGLRQAGHNVILPTLALKAFRQMPEAATPERVAGVCRLVECFGKRDAIELAETDSILDVGPAAEVAELILAEFLRVGAAFDGRGQGWTGHLLTYGRALLDLREMGHHGMAELAEPGFRLYLKRIRSGPLAIDVPRAEHARSAIRPHQLAYWTARRGRDPGLGHVFKYPYGFYGVAARAGDPALIERCWEEVYRVF